MKGHGDGVLFCDRSCTYDTHLYNAIGLIMGHRVIFIFLFQKKGTLLGSPSVGSTVP